MRESDKSNGANMTLTRREMCALFSAGALPSFATLQNATTPDESLPSATYPFEKLAVQTSATHVETRHVLKGKLATGESLEVHETTLPPGVMPHAPHHHVHSEMWFIREGTVELTINGTSNQLGPGGVGFVHSNEEHGIKSVGSAPAKYFVVAVGPGAGGR
jgi:mannose-6-phosphate isomerase-like protein (cupin superfamily)